MSTSVLNITPCHRLHFIKYRSCRNDQDVWFIWTCSSSGESGFAPDSDFTRILRTNYELMRNVCFMILYQLVPRFDGRFISDVTDVFRVQEVFNVFRDPWIIQGNLGKLRWLFLRSSLLSILVLIVSKLYSEWIRQLGKSLGGI